MFVLKVIFKLVWQRGTQIFTSPLDIPEPIREMTVYEAIIKKETLDFLEVARDIAYLWRQRRPKELNIILKRVTY